jgi:hypothetical protein
MAVPDWGVAQEIEDGEAGQVGATRGATRELDGGGRINWIKS